LPKTPDDVGVWAEHLPAVEAFLSVQTQWRTRGGDLSPVVVLGLDYPAVDVGLRRAGIELSPRSWNDLQIIELAAVAALNED